MVLEGDVVSIKEFGAFIEFAPGKEGMVHISKIAKQRIDHVEDVLSIGDHVKVVCLGKDKMGRLSFSIKDVARIKFMKIRRTLPVSGRVPFLVLFFSCLPYTFFKERWTR